ncbi:MAG TPA: hypothetical protein VGJ57_10745 [Nitrospirales bacterium]|jgi:hypothetical protein
MLIVIVGLAGLLSFGSASMVTGVTGNEPRPEERLISHTVGSVEMVKQEQPKPETELPLQAEGPK